MGRRALGKAYENFRQECDKYRLIAEELERNPPDGELMANDATLAKMISERFGRILRCAEEGKPFIAAWYCCAPEIYVAMDLPWYMIMNFPFMPVSVASLLEDIDKTEEIGLANDMCSAIRLAILAVENGTAPPPTAVVGLLHPCDGIAMLHNVVEHNKLWRDVPMFSSDPPYFEDERSIEYYTAEMKRMTSFLEEHTGHKLDVDRLREVVEESNKQYELWMEYNELRRAVPCPHGWGTGSSCMGAAQYIGVGDPRATAWFRTLIQDAEQRVREKRGWLQDERIRVFWFDVPPLGWKREVIDWCEREWGANFVMDMFGYTPYSLIDTSSEDSMIRGLAKRAVYDTPMIRQAQGVADNFLNDIARIVEDYKIDCVVWPGHVGHKDSNAAVGIMREFCRDLGVAFLTIGVDLYDIRYTTTDEIKHKVDQFFTAMALG
jgi:benzoyl-CoA reductase/2-hydroxyglutaryl-CoA dehydratase subunit BcrC/BadD/HgdB